MKQITQFFREVAVRLSLIMLIISKGIKKQHQIALSCFVAKEHQSKVII